MRRKVCLNSKHVWRRVRKHDVCDACGTSFPCAGGYCDHEDCASARELGIEVWEKEGIR